MQIFVGLSVGLGLWGQSLPFTAYEVNKLSNKILSYGKVMEATGKVCQGHVIIREGHVSIWEVIFLNDISKCLYNEQFAYPNQI